MEFELVIEEIMQSIREAGLDPYAQLYGYVTTGKEEYITRRNGARAKIKLLNWRELNQLVERMEHKEQ